MLSRSIKLSILGILALILAGCQQMIPAARQPAITAQPARDEWDDREIFSSGLIKAEQNTLKQMSEASFYHIKIEIAADLASLKGQQRVRYTNQEDKALDILYFQLFPNQEGGKSIVTAAKIDGVAVEPVYEEDISTVGLPLISLLQPHHSVIIQMDFSLEIPTSLGGNFGLFGYLNNVLVLDGFYPAIPVFDAKGWHKGKLSPISDTTFQDASFYVVHVTAPAGLKLVTSGVQVASDQSGDTQVVTFAAGPARDFYIAASQDFDMITAMAGETRVNSYALHGYSDGAQLALRTAVSAIKSYSLRLGTYPYSEFDIVSTPMQGALGIEYPGMTGINYAIYDISGKFNALPADSVLEATVAHEVGHQWFYNVIGNDQINQPWLDESLTQYVTGLYFLDQYGQQGWDGFRRSWINRWESDNRSLIPIGLPAKNYPGQDYSAIVYGRGPLFIEALEQKLGQTAFDQFLRDYYQSQKWGIATTAIFQQLAEKHCQCDLTVLFDEWVYPK